MQKCSHRYGTTCTHPLNESGQLCVMLDMRVADCRWWKSDRRNDRVVVAAWTPKPQAHLAPEPKDRAFVGPPKPDLRRWRAKQRAENLKQLAEEGKLASPFAALFKDTK